MKKTLLLVTVSLFFSGAYAQSQSQEAAPQFDSRPQIAAEAIKNAKPTGIVRIHDGSTANGSGSGVMEADKAALIGAGRAEARVARPHHAPMQGGTPQ